MLVLGDLSRQQTPSLLMRRGADSGACPLRHKDGVFVDVRCQIRKYELGELTLCQIIQNKQGELTLCQIIKYELGELALSTMSNHKI